MVGGLLVVEEEGRGEGRLVEWIGSRRLVEEGALEGVRGGLVQEGWSARLVHLRHHHLLLGMSGCDLDPREIPVRGVLLTVQESQPALLLID